MDFQHGPLQGLDPADRAVYRWTEMTLGERLKSMLAEKGLSQAGLARLLGATPTTVGMWCTDRTQPSLVMLARIARHLDTTAAQILGEAVIGDRVVLDPVGSVEPAPLACDDFDND